MLCPCIAVVNPEHLTLADVTRLNLPPQLTPTSLTMSSPPRSFSNQANSSYPFNPPHWRCDELSGFLRVRACEPCQLVLAKPGDPRPDGTATPLTQFSCCR